MAGTVLITGAARRIGAAIARRFAQSGFRTVIHFGQAEAEARALAASLGAEGARAECLHADLSDPAALDRALADLAARHPDWSVTVNNASVFDFDSAEAPSHAVWLKAEAVNLWAAIAISKAFCAARQSQKQEQSGAIVNLLDQKLANLNPDFFSYTLAKAALEAAGRMLALRHAPHIRICAVAPGLTLPSSDQTDAEFRAVAARNLLQRPTLPRDIADAVLFAATSALSSGQTLYVDGGQRFLPSGRDVMFTTRA
jgi:NAD(P)-dependent dehydrogenase (short-subunit alcohol dehydrogenase family)